MESATCKFAHLQTGIGTLTATSTYFGPFRQKKEADAFVEKVRLEFGRLENTSVMAISFVEKLPEERGALKPKDFLGFKKIC